jgi:hypothetical protein
VPHVSQRLEVVLFGFISIQCIASEVLIKASFIKKTYWCNYNASSKNGLKTKKQWPPSALPLRPPAAKACHRA